MKRLDDDTKETANKQVVQIQAERQQAVPRVGRLLLLSVDDTLDDTTPFGTVRRQAFSIMPKEALLSTGSSSPRTPSTRWICAGRRWTNRAGECVDLNDAHVRAIVLTFGEPRDYEKDLAPIERPPFTSCVSCPRKGCTSSFSKAIRLQTLRSVVSTVNRAISFPALGGPAVLLTRCQAIEAVIRLQLSVRLTRRVTKNTDIII
jgi:hypothetical protein